jgi:hypothetical protein
MKNGPQHHRHYHTVVVNSSLWERTSAKAVGMVRHYHTEDGCITTQMDYIITIKIIRMDKDKQNSPCDAVRALNNPLICHPILGSENFQPSSQSIKINQNFSLRVNSAMQWEARQPMLTHGGVSPWTERMGGRVTSGPKR